MVTIDTTRDARVFVVLLLLLFSRRIFAILLLTYLLLNGLLLYLCRRIEFWRFTSLSIARATSSTARVTIDFHARHHSYVRLIMESTAVMLWISFHNLNLFD